MLATDELASILAREVDCLGRLLAILEREHAALTTDDIEQLERVTLDKNAGMAEQAELAMQRGRLLANAGYDSSNTGLQAFIAASTDAAPLNQALESLGDLSGQCQHYNRENGRIIVQKQQHTRNALNILRQNDAASPTYSLRGLTTTPEDSRTLGKA
jgi:flagellar biosynthesis/type III secretory pathway chaperone